MTVFAYKDGVLATDSGVFLYGTLQCRVRKAHKTESGFLYACTGPSSNHAAFSLWFEEPKLYSTIKLNEDFSAVSIGPDGVIHYYDHLLTPVLIVAECVAGGIASDMAFGAMDAGASAVQAIEICIARSDGVRGPVQFETLG